MCPLVKFIEDPFNGPGIHAGTMVFYSKYKVSAVFINADGNRSSFRGKFDRIVDQVDSDLSEQGTVSGKADLLDLQVKGDFFLIPFLFQHQDRLPDLFSCVELFRVCQKSKALHF